MKLTDAEIRVFLFEKVVELLKEAAKWAGNNELTWTQVYIRAADGLSRAIAEFPESQPSSKRRRAGTRSAPKRGKRS